jgi:serine phosphatase RsbU (regulator of sigma subunit)
MLPAVDANELLRQLTDELQNFEDIALQRAPMFTDIPRLAGIDVYGRTFPLRGAVGGDHMLFVDFKRWFDLDARIARALDRGHVQVAENLRWCRRSAGVALFDVSGHRVTDALLAVMLHGAFVVGAMYEVETFGKITKRLVQHLNTYCCRSTASNRFISMIYGEVSEDARFRFVSAGQGHPKVFSVRHDRFMHVDPSFCMTFPPLGVQPPVIAAGHSVGTYELNQWVLMGEGDILILSTDGLMEHENSTAVYSHTRLEATVRRLKQLTAAEICAGIREDLISFATPTDDISMVIIKRTGTGDDSG